MKPKTMKVKVMKLGETKQFGYMSSAVRFISNYEKKHGKQKFVINQLDEGCYEVENMIK